MKIWHLTGYVVAAAVLGGALSNLAWKNNSRPETSPPAAVAPVDVYTAARNCTVLIDTDTGQGSGVLVLRTDSRRTQRVFVWTAYHVVEGVEWIKVKQGLYLEGYRVAEYSAPALLIAYSAPEDLALLVIDYPVTPWNGYATFTPWEGPRIGQQIFHVGNLFGDTFPDSVTAGMISRLNVTPNLEGWPWPYPLDQSDTVVKPGSSGGGMYDARGNCIGILVGIGAPGVSVYVPLRRMAAWADEFGISWAISGQWCPTF